MEATVRIYIAGNVDAIPPKAMAAAFTAFADLLDAPESGGQWRMENVRLGSLLLEARPHAQTQEEIDSAFNEIVSGVNAINATGETPSSWSHAGSRAVQILRDLASSPGIEAITLTAGDQTASFATTPTTSDTPKSHTSIGSVTGILDRITTRSHHEFGLVDETEKHPVKVRFTPDQLDTIIPLVGKRVCARGKLVRDMDGRKVLLTLRRVEVLEEVEAPSVSELFGVLGPLPDGVTVEELVREMRRA